MAKAGKVTITDVANTAGVSVGTVSHVLSGRINVSSDLRSRVLGAIEQLGYTPNFHAQGLRQLKSFVVGLCLPHARTTYMSMLLEQLEQAAGASDYTLLHAFSAGDSKIEKRRVLELLRLKVDGLLLYSTTIDKKELDYLAARGGPVVLLDRSNDDDRFDQVILDNRAATLEAGERLYDMGHRNIIFICRTRRIRVTAQRLDGLAQLQQNHPGQINVRAIEFENEPAKLARELKAIFRTRERDRVVITSNSQQAQEVIAFCIQNDIRWPDDVSLVTFDDPDWSTIVSPPLSVIRPPAKLMAEIAWRLCMERISAAEARGPQRVVLRADVEFRQSVKRV